MTVITETSLADWDDICAIYVEGINGGNATFSTAPPDSYEEWMDGKKGNPKHAISSVMHVTNMKQLRRFLS